MRRVADETRSAAWRSVVRATRWGWPGWWIYTWYIRRFVRHDCWQNPIICKLDFLMHFGVVGRWLDV